MLAIINFAKINMIFVIFIRLFTKKLEFIMQTAQNARIAPKAQTAQNARTAPKAQTAQNARTAPKAQTAQNARTAPKTQTIKSMHKSTVVDTVCNLNQDDLLNLKDFQKGMADYINNSNTPITFAIQGEWGSGKTSVMKALQSDLCGTIDDDKPYYGIWINTWQFTMISSCQQATVNILKLMVNQITNTANSVTIWGRLKTTIAMGCSFLWRYVLFPFSILVQLFVLFLNSIGVCKVDLLSIRKQGKDLIHNIGEMYKKNDLTAKDNSIIIENFKKNIENLTEKVLKKSNKKGFIFFVDDLDRIDPKLAVELLEIFKNFFDLEQCIFVVAVDYNVVVKGLEPKLGEMSQENSHEFKFYFDKLIQLSISLPVFEYDINKLLKKFLADTSFFLPEELDDDCLMSFLCGVTLMSIGANPRSLKRLINILSFIDTLKCFQKDKNIGIWGPDNDNIDQHGKTYIGNKMIIFSLVCIQVAYPFIYNILLREPDLRKWNDDLALSYNAPLVDIDDFKAIKRTGGSFAGRYNIWELTLFRICQLDPFLQNRFVKIYGIINEIKIMYGGMDKMHAELLFLMPRLSVTNINYVM